jgi:tRNA pseudouridine38-40 synthase
MKSEISPIDIQRYFFEISYLGTDFVGWQIQPNGKSIEEEIELQLSRLHSDGKIDIIGCGRTDAGVHANHFVFHVDLPPIQNSIQFLYKLNKMLPQSIRVISIKEVTEDSHARFHAKERTYRYFIHQEKNPFNLGQSFYMPHQLDFDKMNMAAKLLIGIHDFACFSKTITNQGTTTICQVKVAQWVKLGNDSYYFEITANRFLRNMVRATVGTLLEIGQGVSNKQNLVKILESKDRGEAGKSVPAHGLFLWNVTY